MDERTYDRVCNEGYTDGYNPYRAERERKEQEAEIARARAYALTPQGKIDALNKRIERECGSVAREWGNADEINTLETSLYAEIKVIRAEIDAEFCKTWTVDVTKSRRLEWNARVEAGEFRKIGAKHRVEQDQGWTMDDLKKAVKIHGL